MANLSKLQKVALAASTFLALISAQVNSNAQAADTATLNISGQISSSTCNITISDPGGVGAVGTKIINLGNIAAPGTGNAGTTLGTAVGAIFSVTSAAGGSTACTLSGAGKWDLALGLFSSQISSIGTVTYLKNSITSGGTDAIVQLKGGIGNTLASAGTPLALIPDAGIAGTLMSGGLTATATSSQSIAISAQFARGGTTVPTGGAFSQTIPLIARYN